VLEPRAGEADGLSGQLVPQVSSDVEGLARVRGQEQNPLRIVRYGGISCVIAAELIRSWIPLQAYASASDGPTGPVRAGSPIQTWPSRNRSAFQMGARALVSSIA
jgi:hypothetical protein